MVKREELQNYILGSMREYFLKYSDPILEKFKVQIESSVKWYVRSLPRHIATSEAEDLKSEAKLAFMDCLKTWDPRKGDIWPYANIRVKGAMQDYLRRRGNDPVAGMYEFITQTAQIYMAFNREEIHHDKVDDFMYVDAAVQQLSEQEQKVINGYYKQDKTFKDIGKDIDLSESQVSRIAKTATDKLRKILNK